MLRLTSQLSFLLLLCWLGKCSDSFPEARLSQRGRKRRKEKKCLCGKAWSMKVNRPLGNQVEQFQCLSWVMSRLLYGRERCQVQRGEEGRRVACEALTEVWTIQGYSSISTRVLNLIWAGGGLEGKSPIRTQSSAVICVMCTIEAGISTGVSTHSQQISCEKCDYSPVEGAQQETQTRGRSFVSQNYLIVFLLNSQQVCVCVWGCTVVGHGFSWTPFWSWRLLTCV